MKVWIGLFLVLAVAGCGAPAGPAPVGGPSAAHPYPLTIHRTGGIGGVDQSITIGSDGAWSYTPGRGMSARSGTLSAAELDQVTQTVSNPAFGADVRPNKTDGKCADAFNYSVSIGPETSTFEECGGSRPLFSALMALLSQYTPF